MTSDYFRRVGDSLERRLASVAAPERRLAEFATEALAAESPDEKIDAEYMVNWIVQQRTLPKQVNFSYDFGEPPLTVYDSEHFYMEVLFWFPSRTAIHGHGFHGAFRVLAGHSLQTRYRFDAEETPCRGLQLGRLTLSGLDVLDPGSVFTIEPREGLLHSVLHLGRPSLTLVVRSRQIPDSDQYTYFRNGLAYMHFLDKQRLRRQLDVIDVLRRSDSPRYQRELREFFCRGNAHQRFMTMDYCRRVTESADKLEETLGALTEEGGDFGKRMRDAVFETFRSDSMWAGIKQFSSKQQRLEIALLELFGSRELAQNAFQKYLGGEWNELLARWTDTFDV